MIVDKDIKFMIYFDNAASSFYKPYGAIDKALFAMKELSANPGRSGHELSLEGERLIYKTRTNISKTFNNRHIERVIFTSNCSEALNFAILGLQHKGTEIVTSITEHNSVLRPLYHLEKLGYKLKFAKFSQKNCIMKDDLMPLVGKDTAFVVLNAVSNVTGHKNEFEQIGLELARLNIPFIVDGAQIGGHMPIDMDKYKISCLCLAGHKGLMSIQGVGVLIFSDSVEIDPIIFGGSGNEAFEPIPTVYPEKLEVGTHNLPAIVSLNEGLSSANNFYSASGQTLYAYTNILIEGLERIKGVTVYSKANPFGIVSFAMKNYPSVELAEDYYKHYKICVRGGFHCAPLLHKALGTSHFGLVRASLSTYNTIKEIEKFLFATEKFAHAAN